MYRLKEILMFLSAFIPMYFLVWIKLVMEVINHNLTFNVLNTTIFVSMIVVIILGIIGLTLEIHNKNQKSKPVTILTAKNITDQHFLGYFSLFVLFAITFDLSKVSMAVVFLLIMIMIGVVYIKNKLFFINPFLNILGFNFFDITYIVDGSSQTKSTRIFYRGNLQTNQEYWVKIKDEHFSFVDNTRMKKQKKGISK